MHDPRLVSARSRAQSEPRRYAVPQHGLAPVGGVKARALAAVIFVPFAMIRSLPFVAVATGAARVPPLLGNNQDTPGSEFGRVRTVALSRRAGYNSLQQAGFRNIADAWAVSSSSTPCGGKVSHLPHRGACRSMSASGCAPLPRWSPSPSEDPMEKAIALRNTAVLRSCSAPMATSDSNGLADDQSDRSLHP